MEKIYKTEDEWKKILGPFQASPGLGSQENLSSVPEVLSYSSTMIENRQGGRLTRVASSFRITLTNRVRSWKWQDIDSKIIGRAPSTFWYARRQAWVICYFG